MKMAEVPLISEIYMLCEDDNDDDTDVEFYENIDETELVDDELVDIIKQVVLVDYDEFEKNDTTDDLEFEVAVVGVQDEVDEVELEELEYEI